MKKIHRMLYSLVAWALVFSLSVSVHLEAAFSDGEIAEQIITLDESNITATAAKGKFYDGSGKAVVAAQLNNFNEKILPEDFKDGQLTLGFDAEYWNGEEIIAGDAKNTTQASQIVLSGFVVMEGKEVSKTYDFPKDLKIFLEGPFEIRPNDPFFLFCGLSLDGTSVKQLGENGEVMEVYWFLENTQIKQESICFSGNPLTSAWEEQFTIEGETPLEIYAKNAEGLVSQPIFAAVDQSAPMGEIYATLGDGQAVSITQLLEKYQILSKENEILITFAGADAESKLSKIEWYGSETAWIPEAGDLEEQWKKIPKEQINTLWVNENVEKSEEISGVVLERIGKKEDIKRFYVVRMTDFAGNVSYVTSAGVLQDCFKPTVTLTMAEAQAESGEEQKKVYENSVEFSISIMEPGISSGIVGLKVEVFGNDGTKLHTYAVGVYEAETMMPQKIWSETSQKRIQAIQTLNEKEHPTEEEIQAAKEGSLQAKLDNLEEGGYTIRVQTIDKVGNESEVVSEQFLIDKQAPEIIIGKAGEKSSNKLEEIFEFQKERTDEKFYTGGKLAIHISDITPIKGLRLLVNGKEITGQLWKMSENTKNGEMTRTVTLEFGKEKMFPEGRYQISVIAVDTCNRTAEFVLEEFVIDATAPTYTVQFSEVDEASYKGDEGTLYYKDSIEAVFQIQEQMSYEAKLLELVVKNAAGETVFRWGSENPVMHKKFLLEHSEGAKEIRLVIPGIEENNEDGYSFELRGMDQAGNQLQPAESETVDYEKEMDLIRVLDVTAPVLKKVDYDTIDRFRTVQKRDYVNGETTLTFVLEEHHPAVSQSFVSSEPEAKVQQWFPEKGQKDLYTTKVFVPMKGTEGELQTVRMVIVDKAGNRAEPMQEENGENQIFRSEENTIMKNGEFTDHFTVDLVAPKITLEYLGHNPAPNKKNVGGIDYFNHPVSVKLTVYDKNFNERFMNTEIRQTGYKGKIVESAWQREGNTHLKIISYEEDQMYQLSVKGTDNAGNPLEFQNPDEKMSAVFENFSVTLKTAVDSQIPKYGDTGKPAVVVRPKMSGKTVEGQEIYSSDVSYEVTVYDPLYPNKNGYASGIESLELKAEGDDGTLVVCVIDKEGKIHAENGLTVKKIKGNVSNLGRGTEGKYVYEVTLSKEVFNTNEITLSARAEDVAANVNEQSAKVLAVDTTPPQVTVCFTEEEAHHETYFHEMRTAVITVTERNFKDSCLQFLVNGKETALKFRMIDEGEGNRDNRKWQASYTFGEEGDYQLEVKCKDLAENEGKIRYEGAAAQAFTLDWTKPKIEIAFKDQRVFGTHYYDDVRIAEIIVTERNFDPKDMMISGEASDAGMLLPYPKIGQWSSSGEVHRATICFTEDAAYTLDAVCTDLAMNPSEDLQLLRFVIDTKDPEIQITGAEQGKSYTGTVLPVITFSDNHYDRYEVKLTHTQKGNFMVDVTEKMIGTIAVTVEETGRGVGTKVIKDLEMLEEWDGLYNLSITVYDKAGHSAKKTITYCVNRFGTTYVYSEGLLDLIGGYHRKAEGELFVLAYNANRLEADSVKLQICCDGGMIQGQKSKADVTKDLLNHEEGWFVYKFSLDPEDFAADGRYTVMISDKDEAGNTKTNSDQPIEFYIDRTKPVIDRICGLEAKRIKANSQTVEYSVSDSIGLKKVEVYVNERLVDQMDGFSDATTAQSSFSIGTGVDQKIRFVVTDQAGNVLDTAKDSLEPAFDFHSQITVSSNYIVLWYANKPLFWSTAAAAAGICGVSIFSIKKKRQRKREIEK